MSPAGISGSHELGHLDTPLGELINSFFSIQSLCRFLCINLGALLLSFRL